MLQEMDTLTYLCMRINMDAHEPKTRVPRLRNSEDWTVLGTQMKMAACGTIKRVLRLQKMEIWRI